MTEYNHEQDWFYEGQISKKLIDYFRRNDYSIVKDNSNNIRARGEDIIVFFQGQYEIIEVKGYPTTFLTNGKNKGKLKVTNPKLQAKHWFSKALLSCIFNYQKHKMRDSFTLALAFPLVDRYKNLIEKVEDFFTDNNIDFKVYFIDEYGAVIVNNLNKNKR